MTIDPKTRDEKLQFDINREAAIASSSVKIDKYEYLMDNEILPSDQSIIKICLFSSQQSIWKINKNKKKKKYLKRFTLRIEKLEEQSKKLLIITSNNKIFIKLEEK